MARRKSQSKEPRVVNSFGEFEKLLKAGHLPQCYDLHLYITGTSERSIKAIANVRALCEEFLAGRYELEVVDIYQQPAKAINGQIIAAPTLVKLAPGLPQRLVGDLSNRDSVLVCLNLAAKPVTSAPH